MKIQYGLLPEHDREGARLYVEEGILPGSFLSACFANELVEALGCADEKNRFAIFDICSWLYNEVPMGCRGSREKMRVWCDQGGLRGIAEDALSENTSKTAGGSPVAGSPEEVSGE